MYGNSNFKQRQEKDVTYFVMGLAMKGPYVVFSVPTIHKVHISVVL